MGAHKSYVASSPERVYLNEKFCKHGISLETLKGVQTSNAPPAHNTNQVVLSALAQAVFELQQPDNYIDAALLTNGKDVLHSDYLVMCCLL